MAYQNIKEAPKDFSSGNILSRFLDGVAFRYYWATEGLTDNDLHFKPTESGMSTVETLEHLVWLSEMVKNAMTSGVSDRSITREIKGIPFTELRHRFLSQIELSSEIARQKSASELENLQVIIKSKDKEYAYPLWNLMNGPIADSLYHIGQIVSFRRSSGNPIPKDVNHLTGTGPELE